MRVYIVVKNDDVEPYLPFVSSTEKAAEDFICRYSDYKDCQIVQLTVDLNGDIDLLEKPVAKKVKTYSAKFRDGAYFWDCYTTFQSLDMDLPNKEIETIPFILVHLPLDWTTEQCEEWLLDQGL